MRDGDVSDSVSRNVSRQRKLIIPATAPAERSYGTVTRAEEDDFRPPGVLRAPAGSRVDRRMNSYTNQEIRKGMLLDPLRYPRYPRNLFRGSDPE